MSIAKTGRTDRVWGKLDWSISVISNPSKGGYITRLKTDDSFELQIYTDRRIRVLQTVSLHSSMEQVIRAAFVNRRIGILS